jgi:soluble cytochrome b562
MEARDEIVGDGDALRKRSRLHVANILVNVRLHLPLILRMRFANVHGQEIGAIFILVVNLDEISNLAAEGRSSVAAENQDQRAFANTLAQVKRRASIQRKYARVRSAVAHMQIALMPLRQRVPQKTVNVARSAHEMRQHKVRRQQQQRKAAERPLPRALPSRCFVCIH